MWSTGEEPRLSQVSISCTLNHPFIRFSKINFNWIALRWTCEDIELTLSGASSHHLSVTSHSSSFSHLPLSLHLSHYYTVQRVNGGAHRVIRWSAFSQPYLLLTSHHCAPVSAFCSVLITWNAPLHLLYTTQAFTWTSPVNAESSRAMFGRFD